MKRSAASPRAPQQTWADAAERAHGGGRSVLPRHIEPRHERAFTEVLERGRLGGYLRGDALRAIGWKSFGGERREKRGGRPSLAAQL